MLNFLKKKLPVGIDISDYSIEVLRLNKRKEVLAYARTILEEGIVQDGKIIKKEKLAEKLKELLSSITSRPSKAILSLPESKIFIHYFELPQNRRGEELKNSILEEALKIIPLNTNRIYWDYISVPGKESQHVLFIGTLKEIIDEYIEVLYSVGVAPIAVDIESISLSRALLNPSSPKGNSMIIDIGARTTNVSIFNRDGILVLSITIPIAGNHFTKAIADSIKTQEQATAEGGVPPYNNESRGGKNIKTKEQIWEIAEKLKREFGFDASRSDNIVLSILQASFQKIIKEIKEAIRYYEKDTGEKIEEVILAGGSALVPKIDEYLSVNLERKVMIGDPLQQIKDGQLVDKEYPPILFANVIGLALRSVGKISAGINLLPRIVPFKKVAPVAQQVQDIKAVVEQKPQISKSQIAKFFQYIRKSRIFIILFVIITFIILEFVVYHYVYKSFV